MVAYALFDEGLRHDGAIGFIHREALVGTAIGCSKKSVESLEREKRNNPKIHAVPIGSLRVKEKKWVEELKSQ
jgi:hypothetical protein